MDGFGERLKKLRRDANMTQKDLADYLGVVPSAVGKYERVLDSYPSVEILLKLSDYFHVSVDYLLRGKESSQAIENNISGSLLNSSFIQANHGGIVYNTEDGMTLSPEVTELLNIYQKLNGRDRLRLLNYAVELEEGHTA